MISLRAGGWWAPGKGAFTIRAGTFFENGAPPDATLTVLDIDGDKLGITLGGTARFGDFQLDLTAAWIKTFQRAIPVSEKSQVNPIYDIDDQPYADTEPSYVGAGTYSATNFIVATTFSAGF